LNHQGTKGTMPTFHKKFKEVGIVLISYIQKFEPVTNNFLLPALMKIGTRKAKDKLGQNPKNLDFPFIFLGELVYALGQRPMGGDEMVFVINS